ncbi:Sec-independent protein translocase subunit TatA/TatB [Tautonia marina]|uniref:Sec-independent protein translocase subunit TatA/TatB n=1 Tax=Tautonia marina TaxID=2653855 RepID=UPI0012611E0B|nr:twin-arginine translocase TatA/TatE family subunit [Tautonia marina]
MLYAFLPGVGPQEMVVIAILGVLLFGKRLPEVGKSLGKGIAEFRRGFSGVENELRSIGRQASSTSPMPSRSYSNPTSSAAPAVTNDLAPDPTVPKFEPPTAAPSPAPRGQTASAYDPQPYHD